MPKFFRLLKNVPCSNDLALILFGITVLRIPNFFEPYWYGDEGIYLTVGHALAKGSKLYAEIVDHKTPIIYYLAMTPTQLGFRILLFAWMIVATIGVHQLAKKFLKRHWAVALSTAVFAIFTTLPWYEGNIPNGELFVMGFIIVALWILSSTRYFTHALIKNTTRHSKITNSLQLLLAGMVASLGMLTKVPALFDVAALFSIGFFHLVQVFSFSQFKTWLKELRSILFSWILLAVGVIVPIGLSMLYYISVGSGKDYLFFGLLYNFHYAGNWDLPFSNSLLVFFFSLPGKVVFLGIVFVLLTALKKFFTGAQQFLLGWTALALVASLLSNRPYPHYFLQAILPLSLTLGMAAEKLFDQVQHKKIVWKDIFPAFFSSGLLALFIIIMFLLNVGLYPTTSYYKKFLALSVGQMTSEEYAYSFNYLMKDNYYIAPLIKADNTDHMFIWGTNPMLYALSNTRPVGKFTVAFHIEDLGVQAETMQALNEAPPKYIVVMKEQQSQLPGLNMLLQEQYFPMANLDNMVVWKKLGLKVYN